MKVPVQITFHGMEPSEAVQRRIHEKVERLEACSDRLMGCHATVDLPHQRHHQGGLYSIRLELALKGGDPIRVDHEHHDARAHEDVYAAIRDAFAAARRQLLDRVDRSRRRTKTHEIPPHGQVVRLHPDQDFGFLRSSDGLEVYFHRNAVTTGTFDELEIGASVRFVMHEGEGEHGPQASSLTPVGKHHLPNADSTPS